MNASVYDLEGLLNWLERTDRLDAANQDLIEDAIYAIKVNNEDRARRRLETVEYNYRKKGERDAADAVARLL